MINSESSGEQSSNRPYAPTTNVTSVIQRLRTRNLPERVDAEYLRDAGIPEGTNGRTLFAMKFLGLIDENSFLTDALKAIHTSTDEEYQKILSGLIRESYKEVFNVVNPAEDTQDKIVNVFRRYTPASQRERMVVFFLGMCKEAGIPTLDVQKARSMGTNKPIIKRPLREPVTKQSRRESAGHFEKPSKDLHPAIIGLMGALPPEGVSMSEDKLNQWIAMAKATLRFIYPIEDAIKSENDNGNDESIKENKE